MNIHPQNADDLLISHPRVLDAAVFGIPDDAMGLPRTDAGKLYKQVLVGKYSQTG